MNVSKIEIRDDTTIITILTEIKTTTITTTGTTTTTTTIILIITTQVHKHNRKTFAHPRIDKRQTGWELQLSC